MTTKAHDKPIAIFPAVESPRLSQNKGQAGKVGTPQRPLLPERLNQEYIIILLNKKEAKKLMQSYETESI